MENPANLGDVNVGIVVVLRLQPLEDCKPLTISLILESGNALPGHELHDEQPRSPKDLLRYPVGSTSHGRSLQDVAIQGK